jgi:FkbM family methyltransferase
MAVSARISEPLLEVVAGLARRGFVPADVASRVVRGLAARAAVGAVVAPVDLGGPAPAMLELDPSIGGCLDLLVTTPRRSADRPSLDVFRALVREATTVVDVGANVGLFTYVAACHAPQAAVRAYEPNPELASLIERNLARNRWAPRASVRREGVSALSGVRPFYMHAIDVESSFEPARAPRTGTASAINVPVVALDDVFDAEGIDPATTVLKIDVEGHEMRVLDGLARTLRHPNGRPTLLMEFLGRAITDERVIERVLDMGLDVRYVSSGGLVRLTSTAAFGPVQELGQWNFLLTERKDRRA